MGQRTLRTGTISDQTWREIDILPPLPSRAMSSKEWKNRIGTINAPNISQRSPRNWVKASFIKSSWNWLISVFYTDYHFPYLQPTEARFDRRNWRKLLLDKVPLFTEFKSVLRIRVVGDRTTRKVSLRKDTHSDELGGNWLCGKFVGKDNQLYCKDVLLPTRNCNRLRTAATLPHA